MASKRWVSTVVLAAGIAALFCRSAPAQQAPPPATAPADAPVDPSVLVKRDLAFLQSQLTGPAPAGVDPATVQQQRDDAARRLLSRDTPQTNKMLLDALQGQAVLRDAKLAVVRALMDDPRPDPQFAAALLPFVGGERLLSDAAARALERFGDLKEVRDRLVVFMQDATQPVNLRVGVVRAMGGFVNREVADALLALAADPKQGQAIQNAAMDALLELTGQAANNHDIEKWKAWEAAEAAKSDAAWRDDVLTARTAAGGRSVHDEVYELSQILDEQYQQGDFKTKSAIITRELDSPDPRVRAMGASKVNDELKRAGQFPPAAQRRLEEMIGDSDPEVRVLAAQFIRARNDVDGLDAILAQLPQETSADAKVAQIEALATLKSMRAILVLRNLLNDPSLNVALAAVKAIEAIAPLLAAQDPALARATAQELMRIGLNREKQPGGVAFRAAAIEAAGKLHDRNLARGLLGLLNLNEADRIRSAALRALGSLGDPATFFQIAQWLGNEPSPAVRVDAIAALGSTSTFELAAETLYRYMSPNTEPDATVREQAWLQFQSLLPSATNIVFLNQWADKFKDDPARRLQVLQALNATLQRNGVWDQLAYSQQNTGETYMDPKIADPAKAAIQFDLALKYWQDKGIPNAVTAQLVEQLLNAELAAKDYDKATTFGAKQIVRDPQQQTTIGRDLKDAVNRLHDDGLRSNDPQKLRDGMRLADAILKMQPPLAERFQGPIRELQQEMQEKLKVLPK